MIGRQQRRGEWKGRVWKEKSRNVAGQGRRQQKKKEMAEGVSP